MKKKALGRICSSVAALLIMTTTAVGLTGCSSNNRNDGNDTPIDKPGSPVITGNNNQSGNNTGKEDKNDNNDTGITGGILQLPIDIIPKMGDYWLYVPGYSEVYTIDENGTKVSEYNLEDLANHKEFTAIDFDRCSFLGVYGGIFYLSGYEKSGDDYVGVIYAVDPIGMSMAYVCDLAYGEILSSVDYYNGKLYVTSYNWNSSTYYCDYREVAYTKDAQSLTFTAEESPYSDIISKANVNSFYTNRTELRENNYCRDSLTRSFDEYGCVITYGDATFEKLLVSGKTLELSYLPFTSGTVYGFDEDYLFVNAYDPITYSNYTYYINFDNEAYGVVPECDPINIGYEDGIFYYAVNESNTYGVVNNHFYQFEPIRGTSKELYDMFNLPGTSINPGITGYTYINGHTYFVDCATDTIKWYVIYYDEAGASYTDIDCPLEIIEAWSIGYINYFGDTYTCPYCYNVVNNIYIEYFNVRDKVAPGYEKINSFLYDKAFNEFGNAAGYTVSTADECDWHFEGMENQNDTKVLDAEIINDKYLGVLYGDYYYGGGAHGSSYSKQYLFDIVTGDQVTIADLYPGTEDDFKNFVAEKTVIDYNSYSYGQRPYYEYDNTKELYTRAYDNASLETTDIVFGENNAYIIYHEYEMGPYASGDIAVEITYEELLGRSSL